ncbi:hypothetical protein ACIQXM_02045 [Arthrobacter sp. NPDC097144]|uniref:hypothetical protein n=1 Tax=Arthrobacter sp. NPDC097144 TaxID=3363946 RepID=UPI0037FE0A98
MDPTFLTALTGLFVAAGTGIGFLIKRADTRRQANEALLIAHLQKELAKKDKEIGRLKDAVDIRTQDGTSWREQLLEHDIKPKPEHWTPLPKEER